MECFTRGPVELQVYESCYTTDSNNYGRRAFTWGRRAQNASSEWNESKAKLVII